MPRHHRRRPLLDRVVALGRGASSDAAEPETTEDAQHEELVNHLQARVERLEQALEGLQDAVHRESRRRDQQIASLSRKIEPQAIARALSDDARKRGL